jgi:hypothetical protein
MTYIIVEWDQEHEVDYYMPDTTYEGVHGIHNWSDSYQDAQLFPTKEAAIQFAQSRPDFFSSLTYVVALEDLEKIDGPYDDEGLTKAIIHNGTPVDFNL